MPHDVSPFAFCFVPLTRALLLVLLVAGGVAGCASSGARRQRPEKTFRVSGYVRDSVSSKPVAGVFVNEAV